MKYRKDTIQTELYRVAWDYVTGKISWATVKYMRETILARYEETREEMMKIWKQKFYTCYRVVYLTTPYQKYSNTSNQNPFQGVSLCGRVGANATDFTFLHGSKKMRINCEENMKQLQS